jgi:dolichol kinase
MAALVLLLGISTTAAICGCTVEFSYPPINRHDPYPCAEILVLLSCSSTTATICGCTFETRIHQQTGKSPEGQIIFPISSDVLL